MKDDFKDTENVIRPCFANGQTYYADDSETASKKEKGNIIHDVLISTKHQGDFLFWKSKISQF